MWALNCAAELEAGFLDRLFQGRFVHIVFVVPLDEQFLAAHVSFGEQDIVQSTHRLLDARLAMAAAHAIHAVRPHHRFVMIAVTIVMVMVMMFVAMAFTLFMFVMVFAATAAFISTAAVSAATLVRKLRINHERRQQARADVIEYT